ncbi:MAG: hypothetical protein JXR83_21370 [Deltaproteobacteria bacterium]|nr:hypothetical protein [Deltaproteobacteria bacterium]
MQVDAWVPGPNDLALGLDFFVAQMQRNAIPIVAANLERRDGSMPFRSHLVRELNGRRIVVVGLVTQRWPETSGLVARDAVSAARRVVSSAVGSGDMLLVVAQVGLDEARRLAQRIPRASAVLVADPKSFTFLPSEVVLDRRRPRDSVLPLVAAGRHGAHLVRFDVLAQTGDPVWRSDQGDPPSRGATRYRFTFADLDDAVVEDAATASWRAALPAPRPAAQTLPLAPHLE